ncbi:MAG: hypothetical protein JWM27_1959 [Gemmatimonadetes bacterium]|nr:hypothetical protein [Gemmatimonadota bacterium]
MGRARKIVTPPDLVPAALADHLGGDDDPDLDTVDGYEAVRGRWYLLAWPTRDAKPVAWQEHPTGTHTRRSGRWTPPVQAYTGPRERRRRERTLPPSPVRYDAHEALGKRPPPLRPRYVACGSTARRLLRPASCVRRRIGTAGASGAELRDGPRDGSGPDRPRTDYVRPPGSPRAGGHPGDGRRIVRPRRTPGAQPDRVTFRQARTSAFFGCAGRSGTSPLEPNRCQAIYPPSRANCWPAPR